MACYQKQRNDYPMGSVSSGTMRSEDLIPAFTSELEYRLKHGPKVSRETRKAHRALLTEIDSRIDNDDCESADEDIEALFDALSAYAGPYFYFGAHPSDGADYGYWLSEGWDEDFTDLRTFRTVQGEQYDHLKVSDTSDIPVNFRGEVAVVNDHGNVTLYVKTARALREIWSIV